MNINPRILFVEDHADTRSMMTAMLGPQGYDLKTAPSVREGLKLARDEEFDLYLLDLKYADGTGKELCEQIREFDRETPILFFSGSHPIQQREALACGAQGFVMKPDFEGLRNEIRKNLRQAA